MLRENKADSRPLPVVQTFQTRRNYYIYDFNTNDFFITDKPTFDIISLRTSLDVETLRNKLPQYPTDLLKSKLHEINLIRQQGVLSSTTSSQITYGLDSKGLSIQLKHNLGALILDVTESCNLRCRYCSYSGNYKLTRQHSSRHMSWTTARDAIDYYLAKTKNPTIGFFGGEPLLRIDFIKKCIEYTNLKASSPVKYDLSTNALLLSEEIIDFFAEYRVGVGISIDGPQIIHDRHRVTTFGKGTFEQVIAKVKMARKRKLKWYKSCVHFLMVTCPPYDLEPVEEFIRQNRDIFLDPRGITLSFVNTNDANIFGDTSQYRIKKDQEIGRLRKSYKRAHRDDNLSKLTIECSLFDRPMYRLHQRTLFSSPGLPIGPNGSCIPGARRLFVGVDGKLYMCERINRTIKTGVIGDLSESTIMRHMNEFLSITTNECLNCWAARFCSICPAHVAGKGHMSRKRKLDMCRGVKKNLLSDMIMYNEILEENKKAFAYMHSLFML